jgi:salicylate hydroxylase
MVTILEKHLPASCTVHLGKRLLVYTEPEKQDGYTTSSIKLEFADGTSATTDVLIGADGVRSAVRKTFFEVASADQSDGDNTDLQQYIDATFTGMSIYRCLFPAETLKRESPENLSLREMTSVSTKQLYMRPKSGLIFWGYSITAKAG